jgi:hypothetical protein
MGIRENEKNNKLAHKYDSHTANLLKIEWPSKEWTEENKKQKRAESRFSKFIKKSTQKTK